jgi:hypothetical protein
MRQMVGDQQGVLQPTAALHRGRGPEAHQPGHLEFSNCSDCRSWLFGCFNPDFEQRRMRLRLFNFGFSYVKCLQSLSEVVSDNFGADDPIDRGDKRVRTPPVSDHQ